MPPTKRKAPPTNRDKISTRLKRNRSNIRVYTDITGTDQETSSNSVNQPEPILDCILDIVIAIDNTRTLPDCLEEVKAELKNILKQLKDKSPGIKLAVMTYRGIWTVPNPDCINPIELVDIGTDTSEISDFVTRVEAHVSGDRPEVYGQFLHVAREKFSWRSGSHRLILVIANHVPKEPKQTESGRQYNWRTECGELNKMGVTVYGVEVGTGQARVAEFHLEMAKLTGGLPVKPPKLQGCLDFILMIWSYYNLQEPGNQMQSRRRVIKRTNISAKESENK